MILPIVRHSFRGLVFMELGYAFNEEIGNLPNCEISISREKGHGCRMRARASSYNGVKQFREMSPRATLLSNFSHYLSHSQKLLREIK